MKMTAKANEFLARYAPHYDVDAWLRRGAEKALSDGRTKVCANDVQAAFVEDGGRLDDSVAHRQP